MIMMSMSMWYDMALMMALMIDGDEDDVDDDDVDDDQSSTTWRAIDDRRLSLKAIDERVFTKFRDKKCRIYKFAHLFYR